MQNKNSDNQATDAQLKQELIRHSHGVFRAGSAADLQKACARLILAMQELCRLGGVDWQTVEKLVADGIERNNQRVGGFFQGGPEELSRLLKNSPEQVPEIILSDENRLVPLIKSEMQAAVEVDMAVAFVSRAGFNLLVKPLAEMAEGGRKIRFLTSTMNELNRPEDLKYIAGLFPEQMQLKVFYPPNQETGQPDYRTDPPSFHVKSFLFHKLMGENSLLIGSSNMTGAGLAGNVEWNYFSNSEVNLPWGEKSIFDKALQQYNEYWEKQSVDALDENFMAAYEQKYLRRQTEKTFVQAGAEKALLSPRTAQNEALKVLSAKRLAGITKTAVVAATGLGKTFLAAFDFQNSGLKNVLFIVHRENILLQSMETYRRVTGNNNFGFILSGNSSSDGEPPENSSMFAMVQTLKNHYHKFRPDFFDYVVLDEFHHAEAESYQDILKWFKPKFFLGLTATPERADGRDVLRHCDYDIAYEVRLHQAIEKKWLVPFQYFAIYDKSDFENLRWTARGYVERELEAFLMNDTRAELIANNMRLFLPSTGKIKAIGFCSGRSHAEFMTANFQRLGIESVCLLGDDSIESRTLAMQRLQNEADPLNVIFCVDIFNEGIDIPALSHVLLLRPTQSFSLFLQQLGRGLRHCPGKEYLVVLDFVGNFKKSYVAHLAINGCTGTDDYPERKKQGLFSPPAGCHISADTEVSKIQEEELEKLLRGTSRGSMLIYLYAEMRADLFRSPCIMDFYVNPQAHDPYAFIRHFKGWLRTKENMDDLTAYEKSLLDTPGEKFLVHLEKDLHPTKSYKMAVLSCLLETEPSQYSWSTMSIAESFKAFYLNNPSYLPDYEDLHRSENRREFPLKKVANKLRTMPLNFMSNKKEDCFVFDRPKDEFFLKAEYRTYWQQELFREMVKDRVLFAIKRYFYTRG